MNRGLIVAAGLAGAIGVALSAAGAHMPGGEPLATAGSMAMAQAPAMLALGFFITGRGMLFAVAAWAIAIGLLAFSGELAFHVFTGNAALAFLAPIGGTVMILGWLALGAAALVARR